MTSADKVHPFDGIHFLHNLPSVYPLHEDVGIVRRKAVNIYRKAVHAGKWQNFAAGIGTGAAYASLHGLHWHPHWLTIIEYAGHAESPDRGLIRLIYIGSFFSSQMLLYSPSI
jgi:hypothetical protein